MHIWLIVAILSAAYVAWDQFNGNPEPSVMKWGVGETGRRFHRALRRGRRDRDHRCSGRGCIDRAADWQDLIIEYVAGFLFGLLIFQALFMRRMMGGSYLQNVRRSILPDLISMNCGHDQRRPRPAL